MGGVSLVGSLLAGEKKPISSVRSPGNSVVCSGVWLFAAEEAAEALGLNCLGAEVEELLYCENAPVDE